MNKEYILRETKKIFDSKEADHSKKSALAAAWVLASFKGVNLKIYDPAGLNPLADFFVIGSVQNSIQAKSCATSLEKMFKEHKVKVKSVEGLDDAEWVLVDTGDIIVHIFQEVHRDIFDLDSLWREYKQVEIPNEFYHSNDILPEDTTQKNNFSDYF